MWSPFTVQSGTANHTIELTKWCMPSGIRARFTTDRVRGGGRDHDEVGGLPDRDVPDLGNALIEIGVHRVAADRLERRAPHEPERSLGRHHMDVVSSEHERSNDTDGLARGDPPVIPTTMFIALGCSASLTVAPLDSPLRERRVTRCSGA